MGDLNKVLPTHLPAHPPTYLISYQLLNVLFGISCDVEPGILDLVLRWEELIEIIHNSLKFFAQNLFMSFSFSSLSQRYLYYYTIQNLV